MNQYDLTGKTASGTYPKLVQLINNQLYDGYGNTFSPGLTGATGPFDMSGYKIINLATGSNPLDAINFGQLSAASSISTNEVAFGTGTGITSSSTLTYIPNILTIGSGGLNSTLEDTQISFINTIYSGYIIAQTSSGNYGNIFGNGQFEIYSTGSSGLIIGPISDSPLGFATNNLLRVIITNDGNIGIGTGLTSSARLNIAAGTTVSNTAPFKLTSGLLNTTAEAGSEEYNNSFYQTKESGLRYGIGGVIADFYSNVGNTTTDETDLYTYTTPNNTLATDGEKIAAFYSLQLVDNVNTKTFRIYFGGQLLFNSGGLSTIGTGYVDINAKIIRVSSTMSRYSINAQYANALDGAGFSYGILNGELSGLTFSSTNILKITGQSSVDTNDIIAKLGSISWYPVANN